jgi:hypothetical protein
MTATMTRRRKPPAPMLDLDPHRMHRGELRPGLYGLTAAMSADGLWLFTGDIKTWTGEYLPSGDRARGNTLNAVRRQAADPGILDRFRVAAAALVADLGPLVAAGDLEGLAGLGAFEAPATTYGLARRRLAVLEGRLIAAWELDGVCSCGGYLVGELHGDGCSECLTMKPGERIRCRLLAQHQACESPDPMLCDHGCKQHAKLAPCWRGRDFCCGCCDQR